MQKRKKSFTDKSTVGITVCDTQRCLRLNDLDEVGDGTHDLVFTMLGLFSFRGMSPPSGVRFWWEFLESVGVLPDTVTIHPGSPHHRKLYEGLPVRIVDDPGCEWTDGNIGGRCTEFYRDGVELGNIVMPLGDCLDCGFGLERIGGFIPGWTGLPMGREEVLSRTTRLLLSEGVVPGPSGRGYVLRKLVRTMLREGLTVPDDPLFDKERLSRERMLSGLPCLLRRFGDKGRRWFKDTHGIDKEDMPEHWPD